MEIVLSAVLGEITTWSINFFLSKLPKPVAPDVEDRLHRVLLRAQVIIDEAMGRQVTNQAMVQKLGMLSDTMHRGCYLLDTFRYQSNNNKDGQKVSQPSSLLSRLSSAKDFCFPNGTTQISEEMQKVVNSLSSMILDANELVLFLASHTSTSMYRQPYSMHLLLGNCIFGRQLEAQFVINFLLRTHHNTSAEELEVLPIIGPFRVGKSTLTAHVCKDERVRGCFSETVFLSDHDLTYDGVPAFREKHQNNSDSKDRSGRLLLVVEAGGDLDEDVWNRFYYACKQWMPIGSKIIIAEGPKPATRGG